MIGRTTSRATSLQRASARSARGLCELRSKRRLSVTADLGRLEVPISGLTLLTRRSRWSCSPSLHKCQAAPSSASGIELTAHRQRLMPSGSLGWARIARAVWAADAWCPYNGQLTDRRSPASTSGASNCEPLR